MKSLGDDLDLVVEAIDEKFGQGFSRSHASLVGLCVIARTISLELNQLANNVSSAGEDFAAIGAALESQIKPDERKTRQGNGLRRI